MFEPFNPFMTIPQEHFLNSLKTNIRSLLDSYHGDWDFLIEMLQNAVDALEEKFADGQNKMGETPRVEVLVNVHAGTVRVSDNGSGMDADLAKQIIAPNFTTKPYSNASGRRSLRGHKGVGLTFLACSTNHFRYCTKRGNSLFSGVLVDANAWAKDENQHIPELQVRPSDFKPEFLDGCTSGTSIELRIGTQELNRLGMTWRGWYTVITTMTAAGFCDINDIYSWAKSAMVRFALIDVHGKTVEPPSDYTDSFSLAYRYPHEQLLACDLIKYHSEHHGITSVPTSEKNKYEALYFKWDTDKIEDFLFKKGDIDPESEKYQHYLFTRNHLPALYALFTHSQRVWKDQLDEGLSSDGRRRFWRAGVQIVNHQMPTGQLIPIALPFRAGNKDRIFMLVDLPEARPDYGRKGFNAEVNSYVQFLARETIDYFLKNRELLKPTSIAHAETSPIDAEAAADLRRDYAAKAPDLEVTSLSFKKVPQYENDVILLFGELMGRGLLKGYEILSASSGSQYDAVVTYKFTRERERLIYEAKTNPLGVPRNNLAKLDLVLKNMEFKVSLSDLLADFEADTKSPRHVSFSVVWDIGTLGESGYELIDLTTPGGQSHRLFHGQTHKLHMDGGDIAVVTLSSVLKLLKERGLIT